ncbi:dephospho-CoA kinase [Liquorilactobacillus aquaticus DSM 21051]|uniref:Dephospho-CoA kinase n=1 Tax=Liquorilactobacillus aquaticus DSM 21051 TaxID=1423725 RepID=A0A0R2CY59_9LACO|nr:dephospho-CoA kinase [Liquorilactobacillus aquaticus]KRM96624.1 dephospho-CoA kinase [Liquorilactobacillus aquaticus DSM 21051]
MTYILGLTGGIASGKSTVSEFLKKKGATVIDGDRIARQIVEPGTVGLEKIKQTFGNEIVKTNGKLDRGRLGKNVFANKKHLKQLNAITGPLIRQKVEELIDQSRKMKVKLLVLEIPLLFEGHYEKYCDSVMTVCVPYSVQLKRLMKRNGLNIDEAEKRIKSQMSQAERNKRADVVIDNSKQVEETLMQVIEWLIMNKFA